MAVWFVSRHPGAVAWARMQGITVDHWVQHLMAEEVMPCDKVIGTLPVQLAAAVCSRGARYFNLSLDLPFEWRGRELSAQELVVAAARLEEFVIFQGANT